jgi:hypothetical protein
MKRALPDRELASYAGILYVDREVLMTLLHGCGIGDIRHAQIVNGKVIFTWETGEHSWLEWETIRDHARLEHLPSPTGAFAADHETVGILITSETPRDGLAFREPHSVVHPIGHLRRRGLERAST